MRLKFTNVSKILRTYYQLEKRVVITFAKEAGKRDSNPDPSTVLYSSIFYQWRKCCFLRSRPHVEDCIGRGSFVLGIQVWYSIWRMGHVSILPSWWYKGPFMAVA